MRVGPSATAAAITAFSVAITLASSKKMSVPRKRPSRRRWYWRSRGSISAPSMRSACRCVSTRRRPMRSPPGRGSTARPVRCSRPGASRKEPRIVPPRSRRARGRSAPACRGGPRCRPPGARRARRARRGSRAACRRRGCAAGWRRDGRRARAATRPAPAAPRSCCRPARACRRSVRPPATTKQSPRGSWIIRSPRTPLKRVRG